MTIIRVSELAAGTDKANAVLSFNGGAQYPVRIENPFDASEDARLEWYFEQHLCFPFLRKEEARAAAESIGRYGEALFAQLSENRDAHAEYKAALQQGVQTVAFEVAGSPEFHQLHWEAGDRVESP